MSVRLRRTLTQGGLNMGVSNANGNISNSCETLQQDESKNAKYEMQDALMKVMTKIFSAKVVVVRLPDLDALKKEIDDEKDNSEVNESHDAETPSLKNEYSIDIVADLIKKICLCNGKHTEELTVNDCRNCKRRFVYECKKCKKKLTSFVGMQRHIMIKCNFQGYYYICLECPFKSVFRWDVEHHIRKLHPKSRIDCMKRITDEDFQANVKYLYKCGKCGVEFRYKKSLLDHSLTHCSAVQQSALNKTDEMDSTKVTDSPLNEIPDRLLIKNFAMRYCSDCNKEHPLKDHRSSQRQMCLHCHTNMVLKCSQCSHLCINCTEMIGHLRAKCASRENFKCSKCDYINPIRRLVLVHYKNVHETIPFECPQCGDKFHYKRCLHLHLNICNRKPYLSCTVEKCSFETDNIQAFKSHNARHVQAERITCPKCRRKFKNQLTKNNHLAICETKSPFLCDSCPYVTKIKSHLKIHILRKHMKEMDMAVCPKCDVVFKSKRDSKGHLRLCKTSKPRLQCKYCYYMVEKEKEILFIQHMRNVHPEKVERKSRRRIENGRET